MHAEEENSMYKIKLAWENFKKTKFYRTWKEYVGLDDWITLGISITGLFYYFLKDLIINCPGLLSFYENIHAELIGIGVTVLILGNVNQYIQIRQEKRRLILQMSSPDNTFAIESVRQLRVRRWLFDGSVKNAYLYEAHLENADLSRANLEGADLRKANLKKADLNKARLKGADLFSAYLMNGDLYKADLKGANLLWAFLEYADLASANLEGANLKGAHLQNAILQGVHLKGAVLPWADLKGANLTKADLKGAILESANLVGANFESADMSETNLRAANLSGIVFDDMTIWSGAKYNKATKWPTGFDSEAAGCILVE